MKIEKLEDLNYQCLIEELYPGELGLIITKTSLSVIIIKIFKLIYHCIIKLFTFSKSIKFPKNIETVIVICSVNQYRTLEQIIKTLPNVIVLSIFKIECQNNIVISSRGNSWVCLLNLPKLLLNLIKKKGFKYRSILFHFDDYLNTPGFYYDSLIYLKKINPKSLLVANDHMYITRSYLKNAKTLGIKTIYTQHASVSSLFPVLEFDYSFLDGEESLDKYVFDGRDNFSQVFLSGSPRFDKIPLIKDNVTFDLGVAINLLNNKLSVLNFLMLLKKNCINFAVRPHPGLPELNFWKDFCEENNIGYSDPLVENPIKFISTCNYFVAGDSSFHLEVALCRKISFYLNFQNIETSDVYEFLKNGLIELKQEQDIIDILISKEVQIIPISKIQYYVANFATKNWGKSSELIQNTINEINSEKSLSLWKQRTGESKIFDIKT